MVVPVGAVRNEVLQKMYTYYRLRFDYRYIIFINLDIYLCTYVCGDRVEMDKQ